MIDARLAQAVARTPRHPQGIRCVVTENRDERAAHLLTLKQQGIRDDAWPRQARTQQR